MTRRATGHHFLTSDLVLRFQVEPFRRSKIAVLPLHIVDLGFRPYELFGFPVTAKTPFHLQGILLKDRRHIIDLAMARRTTNAFCYVDAVIKIGEFRKVVYAFPFDRFIVAKACPDGFQIRAVGPDLAVAIHAGLSRRNTG